MALKNEGEKEKASFKIYVDRERGSIDLRGDDLILSIAGGSRTIKQSYVVGFDKTCDMALNKVGVTMSFYDFFGNKETREFAMLENDYRVLKKILKK
ncbi:hypothetical protein H0N96_01000 [Candidatus Micrarchaeota archaeon]|nr:hypothetical protein [Candidatus Micrarchaeota archaeon]